MPRSRSVDWVFRFVHRVVLAIRWMSYSTTIERAQSELALKDAQQFIYQCSSHQTLIFEHTRNLRDHCMKLLLVNGAILEFGVYRGTSINHFARHLKSVGDNRTIFGFDSFSGFSEEWSGVSNLYPTGHFDLAGAVPVVEENVELVVGYIERSLPEFLLKKKFETVAFVHIDTDTYSPAKTALESLRPFLVSGSIVLFDELCGYPNWRNHEYRALTEVFTQDEYEFIGFASGGRGANFIKAAIRVK